MVVIGAENTGALPIATLSGLRLVHIIGKFISPMPGSAGIPAVNVASKINEFYTRAVEIVLKYCPCRNYLQSEPIPESPKLSKRLKTYYQAYRAATSCSCCSVSR